MAVFDPVNSAGPDQRRKQLIGKLMQQAQNNMGAAHVAAGALGLGAVGPTFGQGQLGSAHPAGTQANNLDPNALAHLGQLGHLPDPHEVSPNAGEAIPFWSQGVQNLHASAHMPDAAAAAMPTPAGPVAAAPGPFSNISAVAPPTASPAAAVFANTPTSGIPLSNLFSDITTMAGGQVPLGGGHFYDPTTDSIAYRPGVSSK